MDIQLRNPVFTVDGRIDCEIEHPVYGWIPFTADPNDVEQHGREIHAAALALGPAEYVAPPPQPAPVPASLSFAQLLIGLVSEQWITAEEGRAWRDRVALPAQVQAVIASLPEEQQFAAETRALAPSEVLRNDPLVEALSFAAGKTSEELDDFFRIYSEV